MVGDPVFLTKNGRGRYVIIEMEEYEKIHAMLKLMSELSKGEEFYAYSFWISTRLKSNAFKPNIVIKKDGDFFEAKRTFKIITSLISN